jgi:hypothetical protein
MSLKKSTFLIWLFFMAICYIGSAQNNQLSPSEKAEGFRLLWDGKTYQGWRSTFDNKQSVDGWQIKDGEFTIIGTPGQINGLGRDIVTEEEFGSFILKFDFKLSAGANSGVKYFVTETNVPRKSVLGLEYQLLDDDIHPDAKLGRDGDRKLASLYDLIPADKPASIIRPIGEWNEAIIKVLPNNHVEHWLNGVKVLSYERGSKSFKELVALSKYSVYPNFGEAEKGHILLQDHGFTVSFRNIKIKTAGL